MDFCLANEEKILKFVFRLIDEDNNEVLTRKDIYKLLTKRFSKKLIFPVNAIKIGKRGTDSSREHRSRGRGNRLQQVQRLPRENPDHHLPGVPPTREDEGANPGWA